MHSIMYCTEFPTAFFEAEMLHMSLYIVSSVFNMSLWLKIKMANITQGRLIQNFTKI